MIVDSHCHAWRRWPYQPPVPDPASRALAENLLWEMDRHGVERACVVCARIDDNPDNNDYVADCVGRYPDRLIQLADVDCSWSPEYHTPGAAERLERAVDRYRLRGFTHYVKADDDGGWYRSEEGLAFFGKAAELGQIASIAAPARFEPVVRELAARFPRLVILRHHMAGARVDDRATLEAILPSAQLPNVHVKLSGFHYASPVPWAFPYPDCRPIAQALFDAFGPERLHWGSDYPVCQLRAMTYQQSLEAVRTHCGFIPPAAMARVLGDSLNELLGR